MSDSQSSNEPRRPPESAAPRDDSTSRGSTPHLDDAPLTPTDSNPPQPPVPLRFDQPTIISKSPPLPVSTPDAPLRGYELGKSLEGQRLNHFVLLEFVGGGGMGAVFRALDTSLNRIVALKLLSRDQAMDEETVRRFRNEAQSAARLDHENIARAYYVGEDKGLHYIAFEFIEGKNIRDLVEERGPFPLDEAISYTLQIADALAHASARDVVHRDIKPSNVLITAQGRAKLVDMGLARLHQVEHSDGDLTASGVTLGTFDYISPEQARDPRSADARSDIYSLGCTLYFMLTGRPPFPDGTVLQKLLQHQGDTPPDPRDLNPRIPPSVSRVVLKMLAKSPAMRYQTPGELVAALVQLTNELGLQPPSNAIYALAGAQRPRFSLVRHLPWLVPVSLLIGAVTVLNFWPGPSPPNGPGTARVDTPRSVRTPSPSTATASSNRLSTSHADDAASANERTAAENRRTTPQPQDDPAARAAIAENETPPVGVNEPAALATPAQPVETLASSTARQLPPLESPYRPDGPPSDALAPTPHHAAVTAAIDATAEGSAAEPLSVARLDAGAVLADARRVDATDSLAPPPVAGAPAPGLLVVSDQHDEANHYPSLRAACLAAKSGDVIELQFNGRRIDQPIALQNVRLTIRAGEGYAPVVVFRPDAIDPLRYPRSMITVTGRQLSLFNVALELELPREIPADAWSLFKLHQVEQLRLERCSMTIRNSAGLTSAYHDEVSFIEIKPSSRDDSMITPEEPVGAQSVGVRLLNCIARGEAVLLRTTDLQPLSLNWDNGLLATTEHLLVATGGQVAPRSGAKIEVELRHLTAVAQRGLCLFAANPDAPYQLPATIHCTDCIVVAAEDAALLDQRGVQPNSELRDRLQWNGDFNFFEGFKILRRVQGLDAQGNPQQPLLLSTWRAFFGNVGWEPAVDRPMHLHTPSDYSLSANASLTQARLRASDGRDAGFDAELLPALPPPPNGNGASSDAATGNSTTR